MKVLPPGANLEVQNEVIKDKFSIQFNPNSLLYNQSNVTKIKLKIVPLFYLIVYKLLSDIIMIARK